MITYPNLDDMSCTATTMECRAKDYYTTNAEVFSPDQSMASVGRCVMLCANRFAILSNDLLDYLEYESRRRNITIQEVYDEEASAEIRSRDKAFSREELNTIARANKPDSRYCDNDNPF